MKKVIITLGDPAGIGPELIIRAFQKGFFEKIVPIIIGSSNIFSDIYKFKEIRRITSLKEAKEGILSLIDLNNIKTNNLKIGSTNERCGKASYDYIKKAVSLIEATGIKALLTLPVSKSSINSAGIKFEGHTETLAELTGSKNVEMLIKNGGCKVLPLTRHIPLKEVAEKIKSENIYERISFAEKKIKTLFGIEHPRLGICNLNPHCGDENMFGEEEKIIIKPLVKKLRANGIDISGPMLFEEAYKKKLDLIISLYHDQTFLPLKLLHGYQLVNITIGLPFIRTSPVHGPAFDIAGKWKSDLSGFKISLDTAIKLSENVK